MNTGAAGRKLRCGDDNDTRDGIEGGMKCIVSVNGMPFHQHTSVSK